MLQLIKYSPKRYLVFEKCQKEFSPESPGLDLCVLHGGQFVQD